MFPASGVRPNSSVPEEFQALPRFRSVDDSRTRPVAVASAEQTVWSSQSLSHGLCLCASPVVSQRSTSGRQTLLSTWTLQQRLTKVLVIVNVVLELCNAATPCFLQVGLA